MVFKVLLMLLMAKFLTKTLGESPIQRLTSQP